MKILICILALFTLISCTENLKRSVKDLESNWLGGLERECVVYSLSGTELRRYKGRFDIKNSENQVFFDLKNKRTIIRNATVICEEVE